MALEAGHAFGNYRLVKLIGEGGFGEVYLVENPLIQRRAAVKVLLPDLARNNEVVWRFLNEARAASAIRHPNIVEVLDAGATSDGAPYILMEYLDGESLHKRLSDRGRLPLSEVLSIAEQAGSALAAAHAAGIVHRDLKPENLFLVPNDQGATSGDLVKILDFGIAKIISDEANRDTMKTRSGLVMGSPAYMSPEQCTDTAQVDLRTDIYSFATILYQALAGRTPHEHHSPTQLMLLHLTAEPPTLGELGVEVPAHIESAIMRALAREPVDRFPNMTAFVGALRGELPAGQAIRSGAVTPTKDRPSSKATSLSQRTAILSTDSAAARAKPAPARRPTPAPLPPTNTTFSSSAIERVTDPDEVPPSDARTRRRRAALLGGGAVVLCGVALAVGLTLRSRAASSRRDVTPVTRPAIAPEPGPKPAELAIPELAQPTPKEAPVPAVPPAVQDKEAPKADVVAKPAETDDSNRRRRPSAKTAGDVTEHSRRPSGAKPSGAAKASASKATPGADTAEPTKIIKRVKF